jgi:hypothetical protein
VIIGITLSTLHHSSLGSLFLITPSRLHEIWYTPWLPILFFVSAIGGGMMAVVLVTMAYGWLKGCQPNYGVLRGIASTAAVILTLLLVLKLADMHLRGAWTSVLAGSPESWLFWTELLLSCVIPGLLIGSPITRRAPVGLITASACAAGGLVLNRLNVGIFGYFRSSGDIYAPTLPEWALSIGIIAAAGLAFLYISERLAIFDRVLEPAKPALDHPLLDEGLLRPIWPRLRQRRLSHVTLMPVIVLPLSVIFFWNDVVEGYPMRKTPVAPPTAANLTRSLLRLDGDADGEAVIFDHTRHQNDLGHADSCRRCHHAYLPRDPQTPCHRCHADMFCRSSIFDHEFHALRVGYRTVHELPRQLHGETTEQALPRLQLCQPGHSSHSQNRLKNLSCTECHQLGSPKHADTALACSVCHGREMGLMDEEQTLLNKWALSYVDAMHKKCISCHKEMAVQRGRPRLAECQTCHQLISDRSLTASPVPGMLPDDHDPGSQR